MPISRMYLTALTGVLLSALPAAAQLPPGQPGWNPLNQHMPPGWNADLLMKAGVIDPTWLQPIRVELPSEGTVQLFSGHPQPVLAAESPAQFSVSVGHFYRLRVADLPELPGIELYPSVEILDRLHPPAGLEQRFPIPLVLDAADLQAAADGLLVTRVIYLERPQTAAGDDPLRRQEPLTYPSGDNLVAAAALHGRPMAIVRIGGRTPSADSAPPMFFGSGGRTAPADVAAPVGESAAAVRTRTPSARMVSGRVSR
ncbi:MAG: hypothetical protein ACKO2P_11000 [Planctomycetota bacterium]